MIETYVAERWLQETLNAYEPLTDLVDSRIYSGMAPKGRVSPFVLFQFVPSASDINIGQSERGATYMEYLVEGIRDGESFDVPHQIAAAIDEAIHDKRETVNYGTVQDPVIWRIDCIRLRPHQMAYYDTPQQVRHSGGFYRLIIRPDC